MLIDIHQCFIAELLQLINVLFLGRPQPYHITYIARLVFHLLPRPIAHVGDKLLFAFHIHDRRIPQNFTDFYIQFCTTQCPKDLTL